VGREKIMAFGGKNSDIDGYMPYDCFRSNSLCDCR
jgi:hypothetical protein